MILGVTGGVGAGKSKVLEFLKKEYSACLIVADNVGHELLEPGRENYRRIVENFGKEMLLPDGKIDKKRRAAAAFADPQKTLLLNSLTHPVIREEIIRRIGEEKKRDPKGLIVIEAALLSEGKLDTLCDAVWYIYCDADTRIRRIMESRGYTEEKSRNVIDRQKSDAQFRAECDVVIDNSGDFSETEAQIRKEAFHFAGGRGKSASF